MDKEQSLNLSLDKDAIVRRVFWILLGIELFIVFLDVFVNHYKCVYHWRYQEDGKYYP